MLTLLLVSAGAHAAFLTTVQHAFPPNLVPEPVDLRQYTIACAFGPARPAPVPKPAFGREWDPAIDFGRLHHREFVSERSAIAADVHAVFDRHQADLDRCTERFADRNRAETSYPMHIEVQYGQLLADRVSVYAGPIELRLCLQDRIRQWTDWPMSPESISVDIVREPRALY